jgi:hypothetical protein
MDRTNQLLLGTAAILILLTAGRIWQESQPPAPLWTLAPVSPSDVTAVSLTAPGGSVRIERAADGWRLVEPVARVADRSKVQDLLRDWSDGFEADLKLVERPTAEELASFELDEARRTTLRLEGTPVALRLGRPVSGGSHFVQSAAGGPVFRGRVPGAFRLQGDEGAWRDRRLFPFAKDDLSALVLEGTHGRFAFERVETPERAWWRAGPGTEFEPSSRTLDSMGRRKPAPRRPWTDQSCRPPPPPEAARRTRCASGPRPKAVGTPTCSAMNVCSSSPGRRGGSSTRTKRPCWTRPWCASSGHPATGSRCGARAER